MIVKPCFFCEAPADPTVPSLIEYCAQCWRDEHESVKAKHERDYRDGLTLEQAVARRMQGAIVVKLD